MAIILLEAGQRICENGWAPRRTRHRVSRGSRQPCGHPIRRSEPCPERTWQSGHPPNAWAQLRAILL